jgi:hypothetical protein
VCPRETHDIPSHTSTAISPAHTDAAAGEIYASTVSHVGAMSEP